MDEDAYQAYRSVIVSPTLRSVWAEVYGDRFWPDLDPPWTQATIEDVRFVAESIGRGWSVTSRRSRLRVRAASCASPLAILVVASSASMPIRWRYD